jgi:hypothetical protein
MKKLNARNIRIQKKVKKIDVGQLLRVKKLGYCIIVFLLILSCSEKTEIEYANGYPNLLAGNWVVFQFQGGDIGGQLTGPYDMVSALDPNHNNKLILDNIYNSGNRARLQILGDTGFFAHKTNQLDVINFGNYNIHTMSVDGYINDNPVIKNFVYRLALSSFENISFEESDISEIIFFRAGLYDEYDTKVDSIMIMGYRKTGFEDVNYN